MREENLSQSHLVRGRNKSGAPGVTAFIDRVQTHPRKHRAHQDGQQAEQVDVQGTANQSESLKCVQTQKHQIWPQVAMLCIYPVSSLYIAGPGKYWIRTRL